MSVATQDRSEATAADELLRWLDGEPADELPVELAELQVQLAACAQFGLAAERMPELIDAMVQRILDAGERLRGQLLTTAVPLPRAVYSQAKELKAALLEAAALAESWLAGVAVDTEEAAAVAASGLRALQQALLIAGLSAAPVPAGLWRRAHRFGVLADDPSYRAMLALAAAQPESMSARELSWLFDFLLAEADAVTLADGPAPATVEAAWVFDAAADAPPLPAAREAELAATRMRHFQLAALLARLQRWAARLDERIVATAAAGQPAESAGFDSADGLPPGLAPTEMLTVLRRAGLRWANMPVRGHRRRRRHHAVQVCIGLGALWELGRGAEERGRVLDWRVVNEDPGGCAIMSISGAAAQIEAGMALGLREDGERPWSVCVVRWVRSDNPDQIELGLQLLAPSFRSAQLAFRTAGPRVLVPALELPALEAVRPRPAFLVPAGTFSGRRFDFVRDGHPLYLAQGQALGLDLQTSALELFQFEAERYPD